MSRIIKKSDDLFAFSLIFKQNKTLVLYAAAFDFNSLEGAV